MRATTAADKYQQGSGNGWATAGQIGILYASALLTLASKAAKAQARDNVRYSSSRLHVRYRYYAHQRCGIAARRRSEPRHSAAALHRLYSRCSFDHYRRDACER